MTPPDLAALQATIAELKVELARARTKAEIFRGLYERQAGELDQLFVPLDTPEPARTRRHLHLVVDRRQVAGVG